MNLIQQLIDIPAQQLNMLIFTLDPPKGIISPMPAPQGDRVFQFLQWAEANEGCGLESLLVQMRSLLGDIKLIRELLEEIERSQSQNIVLPISIPLPDPKTITTGLLLEISRNEDYTVFHVWDDRWYQLSSDFPGIGTQVTEQVGNNIRYAKAWKSIHTLTEKFYPRYMKLHSLMDLAKKIPKESEELKYKSENYFQRDIVNVDEYQLLSNISTNPPIDNEYQLLSNISTNPPIDDETELVEQLRKIPYCSGAISQSLTYRSDSRQFILGVDLVKTIADLLLHSLHIADFLLENFFSVNIERSC